MSPSACPASTCPKVSIFQQSVSFDMSQLGRLRIVQILLVVIGGQSFADSAHNDIMSTMLVKAEGIERLVS